MPFTFKRTTQIWDMLDSYQIKLKRKFCGDIYGLHFGNGDFTVRFRVIKKDITEDGNPNCKWRWMTLKTPKFQTPNEAKEWINANETKILKLNIYLENE